MSDRTIERATVSGEILQLNELDCELIVPPYRVISRHRMVRNIDTFELQITWGDDRQLDVAGVFPDSPFGEFGEVIGKVFKTFFGRVLTTLSFGGE